MIFYLVLNLLFLACYLWSLILLCLIALLNVLVVSFECFIGFLSLSPLECLLGLVVCYEFLSSIHFFVCSLLFVAWFICYEVVIMVSFVVSLASFLVSIPCTREYPFCCLSAFSRLLVFSIAYALLIVLPSLSVLLLFVLVVCDSVLLLCNHSALVHSIFHSSSVLFGL
jgi:hypothetical protein